MEEINVMRAAKGEKMKVKNGNVYVLTRTETFEATNLEQLQTMLQVAEHELNNAERSLVDVAKHRDKIANEVVEIKGLIALAKIDSNK